MSIDIKTIDMGLLQEKYEEFLTLKNYNSSLHFDKGDIDGFNRKKLNELFEHLKQERAYLFGAFDGGRLVGFIWGYPRTFFDEKRIFINSLVVAKEYEKMGIGKLLVKRIGWFAKNELRCEALDVMVAKKNENAIGFYEHLGFKAERVQMRLPLSLI